MGQRIIGIEFLRGLAALAVATGHFQFDLQRTYQIAGPIPHTLAAIGVDIFFVISGFVIVLSAHRLRDQPKRARQFLLMRIIRIVPLYWLVTAIYLAIATVMPSTYSWHLVLLSFLFIPASRTDGIVQPVVGQGWTLNFEMLFYVVFAAAFALSFKYATLITTVVLVTICLVGPALDAPLPFSFWADTIVLEFALGAGLATLYLRGLRVPVIVALMLIALSVWLFAYPIASSMRAVHFGVPSLLLVSAFALSARPLLPDWRAIYLLGAWSYAIYLAHSIPIRAVLALAGQNLPFWPSLLLAMIGTLMLAAALHTLFEKPVMLKLRQMWLPARH